jgi:hypothetical protein
LNGRRPPSSIYKISAQKMIGKSMIEGSEFESAIPTTVINHYIECFVSTRFIPQIGIYINKFNNN